MPESRLPGGRDRHGRKSARKPAAFDRGAGRPDRPLIMVTIRRHRAPERRRQRALKNRRASRGALSSAQPASQPASQLEARGFVLEAQAEYRGVQEIGEAVVHEHRVGVEVGEFDRRGCLDSDLSRMDGDYPRRMYVGSSAAGSSQGLARRRVRVNFRMRCHHHVSVISGFLGLQ